MQTPAIGLMTIPYHRETMGVQTLAHMERKTGALGNDNPFPEILMLHISFQGCNCQKVPVKLIQIISSEEAAGTSNQNTYSPFKVGPYQLLVGL